MDLARRRLCLVSIPALGAGLAPAPALGAEDEDEVTPAEDLMREHGVLKRVLLVYDEVRERIAARKAFPAEAVTSAANIIRSFIEQYHEKLEEEQLFPRFRKAGKLVSLVDTLDAQHKAGRRLTDQILGLAGGGLKAEADRQSLAAALREFGRMYAPHEAREDTVLFPAIRDVVSKKEYEALGEQFEKKEHELLGEQGFEGMVERVAGIENQLGIFDLEQFTPR
jgi:hemerythrin-like domain-containing protein